MASVEFGSRLVWIIGILFVAGCAAYSARELEQRYGTSQPRDRLVTQVAVGEVDYWQDVKPIIDQRCVVCHACYDAPCQLKLSSIEGIERGGSPAKVYQQSRLKMAPTTRLFEDAQTVSQWRAMGFHPVLNEFVDTPQANREVGVMHRLLKQKQAHPLPSGTLLPKDFDLSMDRKEFCAKPATLDEYERKHPLWGMPYALPALDGDQQATLLRWLEEGATYTGRPELTEKFQVELMSWESFLNEDSLKAQLAARYIYEHLFLAHLYFPDLDQRTFFKLVRSATPPGQPVRIIATRRSYNDPGVERVYYRMVEERGTIVAKTHMPYALDTDLMDRWQEWFLDSDYEVSTLPSYDEKSAANPFLTFREIPTTARYRFLLERARFTINSFIKGPVCRGQVALNVINDRFWVFFMNPDQARIKVVEEFSAQDEVGIELPASTESIYRPIVHWRRYAKQQKARLAALDVFLSENYIDPQDVSLNMVWNGDGSNDNAALTVFRHFDSANVEQGLIGEPPKTAWLVGYALLERIHYLLVAGYDVYGNVGHQVFTRVYMDFLRMEGETAFLMLLPQEARERERRFWYRKAEKEVDAYMRLPRFESAMNLNIEYTTGNEKLELYDMLKHRLADVLAERFDLTSGLDPMIRKSLSRLQTHQGHPVTLMPQVAFVQISDVNGTSYATILRDNAHLNITSMLGEKKFRQPDEDTLTVVPGFLGAYPNTFFKVEEAEIDNFVSSILALSDEDDYARLLADYGVRRTSEDFWRYSDALHVAYREHSPVEYGRFDYNRIENR